VGDGVARAAGGDLVEHAVDVADKGAVTAAREHGAVALVEHHARDGTRVLERTGIINVLGRDELLQLAAQLLRDRLCIGVKKDGDPFLGVFDRQALDRGDHKV